MPSARQRKWLYWGLTVVFVGSAGLGGLVELCTDGPANIVAVMQHLGYPLYLMKILGFAKALGMVAILSDRSARLKEWAYAGFFVDFLGAAASHALVGDRAPVVFPLLMMIPFVISYVLWHQMRVGSPTCRDR